MLAGESGFSQCRDAHPPLACAKEHRTCASTNRRRRNTMGTTAADIARWKDGVREEWTGSAELWGKWHPQFAAQLRAATDALLGIARVRPGLEVLDLAAGSGEPTLALAAAVGPTGHVTATDLMTDMADALDTRAHTLGFENVTAVAADADALTFPDEHFDLVTCRFGIMYFAEPDRALRDVRRVLRVGGRAAFTAIGPLDRNPSLAAVFEPLSKHLPAAPAEPGAPNPFRYAEPGTLSAALQAAGFGEVEEELRTLPSAWYGPPEQWWEAQFELGAPIREAIDGLSPAARTALVEEVLQRYRAAYDGTAVRFPMTVVLATGVR